MKITEFGGTRANGLWGFSKFIVRYLPIRRVAGLQLRNRGQIAAVDTCASLLARVLARRYGRYNGG
jgi:hypothetical protein